MHKKWLRLGWPVRAVLILILGVPLFGTYPQASNHDRPERASFTAAWTGGLKGIDYGPFREGQSPERGTYPTLAQVRQDMPLLKLVANHVRIYGCQHSDTIITATREISLPLTLGIWLSGNSADNSAEINCAVSQAQANSHISSIVVGNESILSGQLTVTQVCAYIQQVQASTSLPVTTAEPWHIWVDNPNLAQCVDYLLVHIHPYWECQSIDNAAAYMQAKYAQVKAQYPNKAVTIGEAGWPTAGTGREGHCGLMTAPEPEQQSRFAADFLGWTEQQEVDFYYFDAFDEPWKCESGRPEVECHWGIYSTARAPKLARDQFVSNRIWLPLVIE